MDVMDATALPSELLVTPQPLIGFCSLDIEKNPVHKSIWDAFNNNRKADRASVQFKLLPPNYEFPIAKPKRPSYEWYHPKGILKRNWMLKHLHVLPAVVVLFQDIEWNDPQWSEKQVQCASLIQNLKSGLQERNTRLALVLIQKSAPLPAGEDTLASERAASLTNACSISTKMLFILPHSDHLMGYTTRLECTFLEMAQAYYGQMAKRVRMHRDQLTASHQVLKIRHQFKLGFISEMRLDHATALKHYTQAYSNLDEIRIIDTNCLEIKTIAGFLNYKICRLMFKLNIPRDAINHFINHVEKYKSRVGFKELLFEHYAWLSTQHSAFAELFCEAIKNGLPALQTQHPGIYFHKAAEYIVKRKEAFLQCCCFSLSEPQSPVGSLPNSSTSTSSSSSFFSEYFGIRTLKTGEIINTDQQIISLVQQNEKNFNHSAAIITLLGQAMAQFKVYKCLRFRKKLAIDMAEEYYKCGDHAKALTLYSLMLPDYRQDKWDLIFTDVLMKTLRCAFLSASVSDFISCSLEALSLKIICDQKERILVLENLWKVFQNVPPVSQSQIAPELRLNWEKSLSNYKSPTIVDLNKVTEIIECFISFSKSKIKIDETVDIQLYVRILTDVPLKIHGFNIILTDGNEIFKLKGLSYCIFDNIIELRKHEIDYLKGIKIPINWLKINESSKSGVGDIKLEPEKCYKILFSTQSHQFLENVQLQVSRIEIEMGTDKVLAILTKNAFPIHKNFRNYDRCAEFSDVVDQNLTCYIEPTFHLVTQNNQIKDIMLVNEYFKVVSSISNPFNVFLQNVGISISVPVNLKNKVFLATDITTNRQKLLSHIHIDIGEMTMQANTNISYYVFSLIETNIELQEKVWYILETNRIKQNNNNLNNNNNNNGVMENGNNYNMGGGNNSGLINDDLSPIKQLNSIITLEKFPLKINSNIRIEYLDDKRIKKLKDDIIKISCISEFKFYGRFYTLNRQPLKKLYCGEDFIFRANIEIQSICDLDILETYFICDHNLTQSMYSCKRKKQCYTYKCGETLEDVYLLRAKSCLNEWQTQKEFEANRKLSLNSSSSSSTLFTSRNHKKNRSFFKYNTTDSTTTTAGFFNSTNSSGYNLNKTLLSKIPANTTIISGNNSNSNNQYFENINSSNNQQFIDDVNNSGGGGVGIEVNIGKSIKSSPLENLTVTNDFIDGVYSSSQNQQQQQQQQQKSTTSKLIYHKAIDSLQATGPYRGFIKGIYVPENNQINNINSNIGNTTITTTTTTVASTTSNTIGNSNNLPIFGIYCIKWRRLNSKDENETKFLIHGIDIDEPPLNIYCTIDDKMFVKIPMTFCIRFKNPTSKVLNLIATLSNTDNFMCSGHKQLNISIFAYSEKEIVYNLYPLKVGWQNLPELTLEYNTQLDSNIDDLQKQILSQIVQRSMPKKVFILPPAKQNLQH